MTQVDERGSAAMDGAAVRISKQSVSFEVAEYIREQIFSGQLPFGSKVPQDAIADTLGVSRLPVRAALIALEADGMVVTEPHRGTYVAQVSPEDLLDHYHICGVIHGLAASRAAEVITEEQLLDLTEVNRQMVAEDDGAKAYELHFAFHQRINRIGGSRRLRAVLHQLSHQLPHSLFTSVSPADIEAEAAHGEILAALHSREAAGVAELCRAHLAREGRLVVDRLRAQGLWDADQRD
jgi:DNA-binding GntR family transcriptional regulator